MNKSLNVFLSVLLCVILCVGVLTSLYTTDESNTWQSGQVHTSSASAGAPSVSFGVGANGDVLAVPMSSRRSSREQYLQPSRRSTGVADLQGFARSANSTGMLSHPSLQGGDGGRLLTHMSSSQTMKSFGGGSNTGGVSMSSGVVSASSSAAASAAGLTITMPSTSMYAYANNRNASSVVTNDLMSSVSGDIAMASSQAYAGIGNTTRGIAGRKNVPGIGGNEWTGWLESEWEGGSDDITWNMLRDLYVRMTGDTDFSNEELWNSFLAWFEGNQSNDKFGWYWAPISDAIPFVLLLCLVYVVVVYRRNKMAKNVKAEK